MDTHLHLDALSDPAAAVAEARAAGIEAMITMGVDAESSRQAVRLARELPGVFAAAGHHPDREHPPDLAALRTLAADPRVVAIGEIGLDALHHARPLDEQLGWLHALLDLAVEVDLPVSVHVRGAEDLVLQALRDHPGVRGVMHYFALDRRWCELFVDAGMHVSFAGLVTRATQEELREAARACPAGRLLLETDAPYGTPRGRRGENRPTWLRDTAALVASVRGVEVEELAAAERANAFQLFDRLI